MDGDLKHVKCVTNIIYEFFRVDHTSSNLEQRERASSMGSSVTSALQTKVFAVWTVKFLTAKPELHLAE